jgi:hypothetical protein
MGTKPSAQGLLGPLQVGAACSPGGCWVCVVGGQFLEKR